MAPHCAYCPRVCTATIFCRAIPVIHQQRMPKENVTLWPCLSVTQTSCVPSPFCANHLQLSMRESVVALRQTEIVLSPQTHLMMEMTQESCIAVAMAFSTGFMVRDVILAT